MSSEKRSYVKKERAAKQEETRRRIAAATAELHEEVGPARTTIAAIAERAGVQRPTVYNNFPDERELYAACQGHFMAENPPPDFAAAFSSADPVAEALRLRYSWWRRTRPMSENVARDRALVPALDSLLRESADARMRELVDALADGSSEEARALLQVAFQFSTWRTLADAGLSDAAAARLMARAIESAPRDRS